MIKTDKLTKEEKEHLKHWDIKSIAEFEKFMSLGDIGCLKCKGIATKLGIKIGER